MANSKCKNSVFCIRFLIFFLVGTICGIWLFRCLEHNDIVWLSEYCVTLEQTTASDFLSAVLPWLRPLVVVVLISYSSWAHQILPVLIFFRGVLTAYSFCALRHFALSPIPFIFRGMLLLPLFYWLCRYADESV